MIVIEKNESCEVLNNPSRYILNEKQHHPSASKSVGQLHGSSSILVKAIFLA